MSILEWMDGRSRTVYARVYTRSWWTREQGWGSLTIRYWWPNA